MARILLSTSPLVSRLFISIVQQEIGVRDDSLRLKDIIDEITANGTNKAALETSPEVIGAGAPLAAGTGAVMYDAVVTMLAGVNSASVKAVIKQFDQG